MKQFGTVVETDGKMARVECDRQSACDMCENAEHCVEKCKKVYTNALNTLGAETGDSVEIETETSRVLVSALIVFLLPVLLAIGANFIANRMFGEGVSVLITFAVLVGSVVLFSFLLNRRAKRRVVSRIVRIL